MAIRLLGLKDDGVDREEEIDARRKSLEAGLAHLEQLAKNPDLPTAHIQELRDRHARRLHHLMVKDQPVLFPEKREEMKLYRGVRLEMLQAERKALIQLRDEGVISDGAMTAVQRDLDLETALLEQDEKAL